MHYKVFYISEIFQVLGDVLNISVKLLRFRGIIYRVIIALTNRIVHSLANESY